MIGDARFPAPHGSPPTSPGTVARPVDWRRMAEPQADGYDTRETLAFAARRGYVRPTHPAAQRIFGDVALLPDPARSGPASRPPPPITRTSGAPRRRSGSGRLASSRRGSYSIP